MSRIENLIEELCPAGVEFRQLLEAAPYSRTRVDAAELDGTTFVGVDNLLPDKGGKVDASYLPNTARLTAYEAGYVLLGNIRPYLKKVWFATNRGGCSGDVLALRVSPSFRPRLLPRFLYYVISADEFFAYDMQHARGGKMPRGSKEAILRYEIPIPPVEVQREVVRILDSFRSLQAELEAELVARGRQYTHYRHRLLAFAEADRMRTLPLGKLVESIASGKNKSRSDKGGCPVYGSTGLLGYCDDAAYSGDALLIARVGMNAGVVNAVTGDFDVSDNTLVVRPTAEWDVRFAFHQLTAMNLNQYAVSGGQPLVTAGLLRKLEITFPPPDEQKRIAKTLDHFEALVNSLVVGLPAELGVRRRQYEHYRDRLLAFAEAA